MKTLKIGDVIYVIFENSISRVKVFALGKDEFVHSEAFNEGMKEDFRYPLMYSDEGKNWTRTLNEAKEILRIKHPGEKITRIEEGYWEVDC